ncbi:uncharacterized protein [Arachis hypogaea]|uniref:uncharacterized protein isoform X1 n=1 Tax=Arachis hypogaea TaxID=3818 RepID=UPI003B227DE3
MQVLPPSTGPTFPSFGTLKHLELGLVAGEIVSHTSQVTNSQDFNFKGLKSKFDQEPFSSADVPECLQNTLEVVKFGEVHGLEHELWLAKFVMENGLVLKRMSFFVPSWLGNFNAIEEFKEKQLSFKKPFSFAFVEFSYPQEYYKVAVSTTIGITVMGFIGFFVKLIFIPINTTSLSDLVRMKRATITHSFKANGSRSSSPINFLLIIVLLYITFCFSILHIFGSITVLI